MTAAAAMNLPLSVRQHLAKIGAKGGAVTSAAKTAACRLNAKRPRVRTKKKGMVVIRSAPDQGKTSDMLKRLRGEIKTAKPL